MRLFSYAWAVEFGRDLHALFNDEGRATQYAIDSHGVIVPLFSKVPDMTPAEFIAAIAPAAQASAAVTGVPASFTIAQAALESGWGKRTPGNNLFGIKADKSWQGCRVAVPTHEFIDGRYVAVTADFRAYPGWQGCMDDHGAFLRDNDRYKPCFGTTDGEEFARRVAAAGYATDPDYAGKLIATMRAHDLRQFDAITTAA